MDDSTLRQFKAKVQQGEMLQKQIRNLKQIIVDLDEINQNIPKLTTPMNPHASPDQHVPILRQLPRFIQLRCSGSSGEDYWFHDKIGIDRDAFAAQILPYVINEMEALLDQKLKELEEL